MYGLEKNITVIAGHSGSGKTEVAVNIARSFRRRGEKTALIDLDIVNPYFRSREIQKALESEGIQVYFNAYGHDISDSLPALGAAMKAPLEARDVRTVIDGGGDAGGATALVQVDKYLDEADILLVINGNRPETRDLMGCLRYKAEIEAAAGRRMTGLIGNTHLLAESSAADVEKGLRLLKEISAETGLPIRFAAAKRRILEEYLGRPMAEDETLEGIRLFGLELCMRPGWLDR